MAQEKTNYMILSFVAIIAIAGVAFMIANDCNQFNDINGASGDEGAVGRVVDESVATYHCSGDANVRCRLGSSICNAKGLGKCVYN